MKQYRETEVSSVTCNINPVLYCQGKATYIWSQYVGRGTTSLFVRNRLNCTAVTIPTELSSSP